MEQNVLKNLKEKVIHELAGNLNAQPKINATAQLSAARSAARNARTAAEKQWRQRGP